MTLSKSSRRLRKAAIGLGVALLISAVGAPTSNATKVQAPKAGGDINVGIFDRVLTTCYSPNVPNSALGVLKTVLEGLVEQRSDGVMVPYLAKSFSHNSSYTTWTVKLRSGIKFHSGEALDAAAVALNLNTLTGYTYLSNPAKYGHTAGSGLAFTGNLKKVTAVGTDTVTMDLYTPQVDWMESVYASGRFFMRAPSDIANATQCATKAQGTGPFMFSSVTPELVKVVKNPNYWRKSATGAKLPYLNSITFKYIAQPSQRVSGITSGALDAAQFTSVGEVKQIQTVKANAKLGYIQSPDDFYPTFWLNQAIAPFNNKNARLAFAYAWDFATYYKLRNCYNGKCVGNLPTSIVGPTNIMYNVNGFIKLDIAKSKKFQAAYKAETGKALTWQLNATTSPESQANAKAVQQILKKAGITAGILVEDGATQVANAFPNASAVAQGKLNPYASYPVLLFEGKGTSFILPFIVRNAFLEPGNGKAALTSAFLAIGAQLNVMRTADMTLSTKVWTAKADITLARKVKLKAITKYLQENAYLLPTPTQAYGFGFNSKIKGYDQFTLASGGQGRPMTNAGVNWTQVYIEK